jgi:2-dehydro-3-deoxyphosphogluconate aldolase/(4S)-4-hydroxy-2-oxoglutarate aldolase
VQYCKIRTCHFICFVILGATFFGKFDCMAQLTKTQIEAKLTDPGIIAVIRARTAEQVPAICEALLAGGVIALEITMSTPNTIAAIRDTCARFGGRSVIGVGTVLDAATCSAALDAGAQFVVTPVLRPQLVGIAHGVDRPIMLGAYSPTEAQLAHEAGADFIKIFPADGLGPSYMKGLRAPLPHLRLVPTGGVDVNNVGDFFKAGCVAVGVGSLLVSAKIMETNNWPELTARATSFVNAARQAKAG